MLSVFSTGTKHFNMHALPQSSLSAGAEAAVALVGSLPASLTVHPVARPSRLDQRARPPLAAFDHMVLDG